MDGTGLQGVMAGAHAPAVSAAALVDGLELAAAMAHDARWPETARQLEAGAAAVKRIAHLLEARPDAVAVRRATLVEMIRLLQCMAKMVPGDWRQQRECEAALAVLRRIAEGKA